MEASDHVGAAKFRFDPRYQRSKSVAKLRGRSEKKGKKVARIVVDHNAEILTSRSGGDRKRASDVRMKEISGTWRVVQWLRTVSKWVAAALSLHTSLTPDWAGRLLEGYSKSTKEGGHVSKVAVTEAAMPEHESVTGRENPRCCK